MKGVIVKGENGKYSAEVVYDIYDANGVLDYDMIDEHNIWLTEKDTKKVYAVDYNGQLYYPIFFSFEEIEEEFDECVADALKKKGYFSSWEDVPNVDYDEDEVIIKVFALDI